LKPTDEVKIMNALWNQKPQVIALGALVVGLIVGLVIGWVILPVSLSSVAPVDLQTGYRDFYLSMVANEYSVTHDLDQAKRMLGADHDRWSSKDIATALNNLAKTSANKAQLEALATALGGAPAPAAKPPATSGTNWPLVGCLGLLLVLLIVAGAVWLLPRLRAGGAPKEQALAVRSAQGSKAVEATAWTGEAEKPLAQFVTTYEIGDDRYDTSFSIETASGDFLGECGVGISETVGAGSPDKVTAFEVWLFDKNDIRTVTKVLMSEYAYGDSALRAKLAPKGEPELARPEAAVELDTATLKVRARVVEMDYGAGELPPNSFFNKLVLELAAWPKEAPAAAAAPAEPAA
jgi:hypothetical protein